MPGDLEDGARQLEFLRGLFRGGQMSQGDAAEAASEGALEVLQGFSAELDRLRDEVGRLREEVERLRTEVQEVAGTTVDEDGRIACPDCGQRLAVGAEVTSGKAIEVTCPSCNALLEVS